MEEANRANIKNSKILTGVKDLDLLILEKLDDRSMLNFLASSKDLYTDENIAFIFGRRYPELLKFKRADEGLKSLYLRMLKYIELLREEFRIVYTKEEKENPILTYGFKDYEIKNKTVNKLLIEASRKGDLEIVKTSVEAGADIGAMNNMALRWASEKGHLPVVQYLVERGADIHAQDDAALRWASSAGHLPVMQYLVERGADISAKDDAALIWASQYGDLSVVQYLVERGANIHAQDDLALRWASRYGHLPVVQYLVEGGANIGAQDDYALRLANHYGHSKIVKYLVDSGAEISKKR